MIDTFKKAFLTGLGAAVVTKDKVQAGLEGLVREGKISASEARTIAEKIAEDGKREFEDVSAKVGDKVRELLASSDSKILARIVALEARVGVLEGKPAKAAKHRTQS